MLDIGKRFVLVSRHFPRLFFPLPASCVLRGYVAGRLWLHWLRYRLSLFSRLNRLANRRRSSALFGGGGVKTQCPVGCIWLDNKVCFAGWKFVINAQFFGLDTHFDDVFTVPRNLPFRFVAYVDSAWFVCFPSGFFDLFSSLVCTMINRYRPIGV